MVDKNGRNGEKDPSPNVLDLVEASNQRQDDLREMSTNWMEKVAVLRDRSTEKIAALRATNACASAPPPRAIGRAARETSREKG